MAWGKSKGGGGGGVAFLALLVALIALFVAWSAYRRTGGSVDQLVPGTGDLNRPFRVGADGGVAGVLERARARLAERRADVAGDRNLEQVRRDVAEVRASLERAYRDSGAQAKEKWRGLDGDLERLEQQLREGGQRAVATLDAALDKMRR